MTSHSLRIHALKRVGIRLRQPLIGLFSRLRVLAASTSPLRRPLIITSWAGSSLCESRCAMHFSASGQTPITGVGGIPPPALSQGPVIPLLALRSFALPVENDGRPPPRAEPRATRGHRRVPRGWQGSCSRLVSTGCVGFCRHGARGEVACISNPRGGCPGLRKDLLLGLFFRGNEIGHLGREYLCVRACRQGASVQMCRKYTMGARLHASPE